MRRSRLAAVGLAAATFTATAVSLVLGAPSATAALSNNWYAAAPYLMPQSNNPPDPVTVMNATGLKAFQLAFILAPNGGGCSPTWDGTSAVSSDTAVAGVISRIRGAGGDVSVSVGGYGGTKLGQTCGTVAATAAAYQQVITKYSLKAIDFDLEEPEYENTAAIANELGAAKTLQANNPGLFVSVTMPGTAAGTGWFGTQLIDQAKSIGFSPNNFSIMPFDGGFNGGSSQVSALEAFHGLLMSHMGWDSATAYAHEGFSGMNGKSDAAEMFYTSDFQTVYDYATSHGLGRFTFWSVNRDRACVGTTDNGVCSNVPQNDWDFTKFSVRFAGATPPQTTPPVTTTPTTPGNGSCTAAEWDRTKVYVKDNVVSHNSHKWTAKWWTQGEEPGTTGEWGVWQDNGAC
ncbi:chitinase [Amycolatopsis mediterranei S699]|uniref:Chitinase n=2 Tax=Amycolatopsis mediterranei TaxID=33910 RepID=A0A0H3DFD5_AMYMU|nr:chitinase [Amycolatopsis mediterranei]ADJ48788.1 chitinase [Amycolatopsis mediterranei U32]AEK45728.1 chitinase [Amycolatopsis mediterranei S699]AFO80497.1 chitinase [Amycolatopsis mediterranei S699]AGT87625.1 chitinase [Amycolatopsis mediterranei RB]KDO04005.1 chitinase [Amycolatopsis mediterranei]